MQAVILAATGAGAVGGESTRALADWLDADDELRGNVRREPAPVPEGALGAEIAQLVVSLGSSGAVTAMASVIIAWLRRRTGSVSVHLTRPDGSAVELTAERVRALDAAGVRDQVQQLVAAVWPAGQPEAGEATASEAAAGGARPGTQAAGDAAGTRPAGRDDGPRG